MNVPDLCPACCTELPADYPFDHVAIDLALDDQPALFRQMTRPERAELILVALSRGMNINQIALRFGRTHIEITALTPVHLRPAGRAQQTAELEQQIRQLWEQGLNDIQISLRTGRARGTVSKVRERMDLAAHFGPGGRRKQVAA